MWPLQDRGAQGAAEGDAMTLETVIVVALVILLLVEE
jgi:hypothetical protein